MRVLKPKKGSQRSRSNQGVENDRIDSATARAYVDDSAFSDKEGLNELQDSSAKDLSVTNITIEDLVDIVNLKGAQGDTKSHTSNNGSPKYQIANRKTVEQEPGKRRSPHRNPLNRRINSDDSPIESGEESTGTKNSAARDSLTAIYQRGVSLLAIREHSALELRNKLNQKFNHDVAVDDVIARLQKEKYLSDERFTEAYVRARKLKGFGPSRIRSELSSKGVTEELILDNLHLKSASWLEAAEKQYRKKFGDTPINDYREWAKRARFLQGKGYSRDHIDVVVPSIEDPSFD